MPDAPIAFISHSHEDKERFVVEFATKLRENGVDAWVDNWEILPGDSLVDKIFNEGLKKAQAVIAIISKNSINSKWVREELNAATVRRIAGKSKLIPIILDDCELPECLSDLVWQRVNKQQDINYVVSQVVNAIFENRPKPTVGTAPTFLSQNTASISGLNKQDAAIMKSACEKAIQDGQRWLNIEEITAAVEPLGINITGVQESLEILEQKGYIKGTWTNLGIEIAEITLFGFQCYAASYVPDLKQILRKTCLFLINNKQSDNVVIASTIGTAPLVVEFLLESLANQDYIKTTDLASGEVVVHYVSPALKRDIAE